ncbi:hypothetical protein STRIP9103_00276, partial [Streptomyces ipomoeae 91-03]
GEQQGDERGAHDHQPPDQRLAGLVACLAPGGHPRLAEDRAQPRDREEHRHGGRAELARPAQASYLQGQGQIHLEGEDVRAGHGGGEEEERPVGEDAPPLGEHALRAVAPPHLAVLVLAPARGQGADLDGGEYGEDAGRRQAGDAEVDAGEDHPDQGAEQYSGLVEDVEQGERLDPALPRLRGEIRPYGRVEQGAREAGGRRGGQ